MNGSGASDFGGVPFPLSSARTPGLRIGFERVGFDCYRIRLAAGSHGDRMLTWT